LKYANFTLDKSSSLMELEKAAENAIAKNKRTQSFLIENAIELSVMKNEFFVFFIIAQSLIIYYLFIRFDIIILD